jgi:hypothetical protein
MEKHFGSFGLHEGEGRDLWRIWVLGLVTMAALCCWFWLIEPEAGVAFVEEEAVMFEAPGKSLEGSDGGY